MKQSIKNISEFIEIKHFFLFSVLLLNVVKIYAQEPIITGQTVVRNGSSYIYTIENINEITDNGANEIQMYYWFINGGNVREVVNDSNGNPVINNNPILDEYGEEYTYSYSWAEGDTAPKLFDFKRIGVKWISADTYSYVWYAVSNGWDYYQGTLSINADDTPSTRMTFDYDLAGNQTDRVLCLSGCTSKKTKSSKENLKEIEAITDEDLQKFYPGDAISYYPNPVKEELYLKWQQAKDNYVSSIKIYGLNGQVLKTYAKTDNVNVQNISFQRYPRGIYMVTLVYTNGEQKTIKIIKQ